MDLDKMTHFADSTTLFHRTFQILQNIGPEKFMNGPEEEAQRAREAFAEYFFLVAMKKLTGTEWWLSQPKDIFPDFDLVVFEEAPDLVKLYRFELVTIPDRCKTAEEMLAIVNGKLKKGYPKNFNLLVYFNNAKSVKWANLLNTQLESFYPFDTVWTIFLDFENESSVRGCVVNRIRPSPSRMVRAEIGERNLHVRLPLPSYMEEFQMDGKTYVGFKEDFIKNLRKVMRRARLELG